MCNGWLWLHPCRVVTFQIRGGIREIRSCFQGAKSCWSQWCQRPGQAGYRYLNPCLDHALSVLLLSLRLYSRGASCRVENLGSFQGSIKIFLNFLGRWDGNAGCPVHFLTFLQFQLWTPWGQYFLCYFPQFSGTRWARKYSGIVLTLPEKV